ncbi:MAG: hypothetical protein KTR24_10705 [Saprospiraceae bacterium]|nr:hypothetical protein [Saprospiraceae bacterium]
MMGCASTVLAQPSVLIHAHNDYLQEAPLINALEVGCASIEVDLILRNDTLFVAHEEESIDRTKTFASMYLTPLQDHLLVNSLAQPTALLIDLKTPAATTLPLVIRTLQSYDLLLRHQATGSLSFVISGNRPAVDAYAGFPDIVAFDYQDLQPVPMAAQSRIAMVSLPFRRFSSWDGKGKLRRRHARKIRKAIQFAHDMDKPFRFWGTPDHAHAWQTLHQLGIDYVNTDKVSACAAYFRE